MRYCNILIILIAEICGQGLFAVDSRFVFEFSDPNVVYETGKTFQTQVSVMPENAILGAFDFTVYYEPEIVCIIAVSPFPGSVFELNTFIGSQTPSGTCRINGFQTQDNFTPVSGKTTIAVITWQVLEMSCKLKSPVEIEVNTVVDAQWRPIDVYDIKMMVYDNYHNVADLNCDKVVDIMDLTMLTEEWLSTASVCDTISYDSTQQMINMADYTLLSESWLQPGYGREFGDYDYSGFVDSGDLLTFVSHWLSSTKADINIYPEVDGVVNFADYSVFAKNWLDDKRTSEIIYDFSMDTNPNWTVGGQWQFGIPTGHGGQEYGNPDRQASRDGK